MNRNSPNKPNSHSDGAKANTPDKFRNDGARWKDHDQPDTPESRKERRAPESDYPDVRESVPR